MANFPSSLPFASLLQYAPRGQSLPSMRSRDVTYKIKQDGFVNGLRIIDFSAGRLAQEVMSRPFLRDYFNSSSTLVPVPRSSPLVSLGALWPPLRISEAILAHGIAAEVVPCLERSYAVQKSSAAGTGQRPGPEEHYDSVHVAWKSRRAPVAITLVDDVVTRGATLLGLVTRLTEAFPGIDIRCFAVVRTISNGEIDHILDPIEGTISYNGITFLRHP